MSRKGFIAPLLAFILIITAVIGGYVFLQQKKISVLSQKDESRTISIDIQEKCAKQAEKVYAESGLKSGGNLINSSFINHYNSKFNRCFILIISSTLINGNYFVYQTLSDAYEGKVYAEYEANINPETKPVVCRVLDKFCHNEEELNTLINTYMEN